MVFFCQKTEGEFSSDHRKTSAAIETCGAFCKNFRKGRPFAQIIPMWRLDAIMKVNDRYCSFYYELDEDYGEIAIDGSYSDRKSVV